MRRVLRAMPRKLSLLVGFALLASIVALPTTANAANTNYTIRVGDDFALGKGKDVAVMRMFPRSIDVQAGDTLTFKSDFHTATALPVGTDLQDWIANNASQVDQPYHFLSSDTDHTENGIAFNNNVFFPSDASCGTQASPCSYDGSSLINSGLLFFYIDFSASPPVNNGFSMTIANNLSPGDHFWVICLVHTLMTLRVNVVGSASEATTQAQIDQEHAAAMAQATTDAAALWNKLEDRQTTSTYQGKKVVDAYAGFDAGVLELFGMFPNVIHIKPGQSVLWHFGQLLYEPHSVVFPVSAAHQISNGPPPMCEAADGTDSPPTGADPNTGLPTCDPGSTLEIELDARLLLDQGNAKVTSTSDYANSGARGGSLNPPLGDGSYLLTFPKASPRSGFRYACGVHGKQMLGVVYVR